MNDGRKILTTIITIKNPKENLLTKTIEIKTNLIVRDSSFLPQ